MSRMSDEEFAMLEHQADLPFGKKMAAEAKRARESEASLLAALKVALARNGHSGACGAVGGLCICWKSDALVVLAKAEGKS